METTRKLSPVNATGYGTNFRMPLPWRFSYRNFKRHYLEYIYISYSQLRHKQHFNISKACCLTCVWQVACTIEVTATLPSAQFDKQISNMAQSEEPTSAEHRLPGSWASQTAIAFRGLWLMLARFDSSITNDHATVPQNDLPIWCNFRDEGICMCSDGRVIAQVVSRRLPAAALRVRAHIKSCGIYGRLSSRIFLSPSVSLVISHSTKCTTHIINRHLGLQQWANQWQTWGVKVTGRKASGKEATRKTEI